MTQNLKIKDLLYFKGKIKSGHITLEKIENEEIIENFKIIVSILKY